MSLEAFMKQNAMLPHEIPYAASKRFKDETGVLIDWLLKPIGTSEYEDLKKECTSYRFDDKGRPVADVDAKKLNNKLAVACTAYPNLHDKTLQDFYGVMCAEDLLFKLLLPGEYERYTDRVAKVCGFGEDINELVDEVKNS